jgi:hypothetical protein
VRVSRSPTVNEKSSVSRENSKTTGEFDLMLYFASENYGTADGSLGYPSSQ